ncbi:hypothetical protein [Desulfurispira natronophila]|uniref:STAS domain-containing protein n=1 Tax=Desulfurispira natronophila TaxID=682562 RepID=A0A7W7Y2P6_9BACT|nr:hypothetical protein [Desulfurispira natronophila]MBB5020829.1 hypothetical protein [Desulfurispira natronophila]
MFELDADTLNISIDMDAEEVEQLRQFLQNRLEYIEHIGLQGPREKLGSSSLLQLLTAIKRNRPDLGITLFEGPLEFDQQGTQHWKLS